MESLFTSGIYSRGGKKKKETTPTRVIIYRRVTSVARDACNVICRGSLFPDSEQSPAVYLRDDPLFGSLQLQQHSELRAPTAERAAFYLDAAVAGRQREDGDAHMLYTLHVYQYSVAGKGGGERNRSLPLPSLFRASQSQLVNNVCRRAGRSKPEETAPLLSSRSRSRVVSEDLGLRRDQPSIVSFLERDPTRAPS